jgi:hypothetical protein
MRKADEDGKEIWIIYLGDHDPSGIDMTRDIDERLGLFLYGGGRNLDQVERIALNMDQIEFYHPPENPAKQTDSRYQGYIEEYGESSWELDALEPSVLSDLVERAILKHLDTDEFGRVERLEEKHRKLIRAAAAHLKET